MDRRAPHALLELSCRPAEKRSELRGIEPVAYLEVRMRCCPGELVPRAHELTVIAAEDAVADRRAQLDRNRAVVLDREVGDAAARIEPVGCDDRARGAGGDAGLAGATVRGCGPIHRQRQI